MKTLQNRLWAKLLAGFLLIVFAFGALAAGLAGAMLAASGVYDDGGTAKIDTLFADISPSLDAAMSDALRYYFACLSFSALFFCAHVMYRRGCVSFLLIRAVTLPAKLCFRARSR